jgi:3-oxoacyl-[acyl-carrier-protein] synthase-1
MDPVNNIILTDLGIISALGHGTEQTWQNLFGSPHECMSSQSGWIDDATITVGAVTETLPDTSDWVDTDKSRCNQLAFMAYQQIKPSIDAAIKKYGSDRVGVILGTSTSGTLEAELAFKRQKQNGQLPKDYDYCKQEMGAPATYVAKLAGVDGLTMSVSTACSSGAKALISAANMLESGMLDAVIAGGVDSLCRLTLNGFHALESLSFDLTNPFSANRNGINIGEGAALFIMEKGNSGIITKKEDHYIILAGFGESSDAHHMSAPHPEGDGALSSMQQALKTAGLDITEIDYINLHGTATPKNDLMEGIAVARLGGQNVPCSSTKPFTGHTLAGAGAIEAGICYLAMSQLNTDNQLPPHHFDGVYDEQIAPLSLTAKNNRTDTPIKACLSNSFAFGGSNVSLVLARSFK